MADVVKIARDRVAVLEAETSRLREFIRMAEKLLKDGALGAMKVSTGEERKIDETAGQGAALNGSSASAPSGGDQDDGDLSLGEPMASQPAPHTFAKQVESALERKNLFRRPSP
jgi:hypothetical protein